MSDGFVKESLYKAHVVIHWNISTVKIVLPRQGFDSYYVSELVLNSLPTLFYSKLKTCFFSKGTFKICS